MKHLLSLEELKTREIIDLIEHALEIKKNPKDYSVALYEKTLLMIFETPSLRTRISFEVAMTQLGGHAIDFYTLHSPWGIGKESIEDVGRTISEYCDMVMARIYSHSSLKRLADSASIPIINAMTNYEHPCQILGDLLTIYEQKKKLTGLTLAYVGDGNNNVTHSLLFGCSKVGMHIHVATPKGKEYEPSPAVVKAARTFAHEHGSRVQLFTKAADAVKDADIVYTDSWMSYRIPKSQGHSRIKIFQPYRVDKQLFQRADHSALFMHCLPANRDHEVAAEVIDGERSIVFQQAENRLHMQKAILMSLFDSCIYHV